MKPIELKTNIMCSSCIAKVTPTLNDIAGEANWKVDIQNPEKILTVNGGSVTEEEVIKAVGKAGFKAVKTT
jgi:copper chaperone